MKWGKKLAVFNLGKKKIMKPFTLPADAMNIAPVEVAHKSA